MFNREAKPNHQQHSLLITYFIFQHCGSNEPSSPLVLMERLSFEMHKTYTETRLQLHLSPATIVLVDGNEVTRQSQILSVPSVGRSSFKLEGFLFLLYFFKIYCKYKYK